MILGVFVSAHIHRTAGVYSSGGPSLHFSLSPYLIAEELETEKYTGSVKFFIKCSSPLLL